MIPHLWLATLTALFAVALVVSLPRISARIRFGLLLLATVRFAVPTPWLTAAGEALAACLPSRVISAQAPSLEGLLRPGAFFVATPSAPATGFSAETVLQALWLLGTLLSLVLWLKRSATKVPAVRPASIEETAALERAAARMGASIPQLRIADTALTPGAIGIRRPEIILPDGLAQHLSPEELESVCAHELAHILRRDNLTSAVSRIIAAAFWFHPLVWWMERRMLAERELACDEMVVASGPHEAYATALSKVCLASPGMHGTFTGLAAGMAGPNLQNRLERIMTRNPTSPGRALRAIPATLALLAVLLPVGAGFVRAQGPTQASEALYNSAYDSYTRKDYAQAETLFRRLLTEYPADARGTVGLAEVHMAQGREGDALAIIKAMSAGAAASFEQRMALGNFLVRTENYLAALSAYEALLKVATPSQTGDLYFRIGETNRRMGRLEDAMAAHRRSKDFTAKASLQLALILEGTAQLDLAESEYKALLLEDPRHPVALNNLAYLWAKRGDKLDDALTYAQRAQQAVPESSDIADTLGWIYLKKSMPDQAASVFTNVLLLDGKLENPSFRQHLAAALDMQADWTPARRELRTLLDTASKPDQLARLQALLRGAQ